MLKNQDLVDNDDEDERVRCCEEEKKTIKKIEMEIIEWCWENKFRNFELFQFVFRWKKVEYFTSSSPPCLILLLTYNVTIQQGHQNL